VSKARFRFQDSAVRNEQPEVANQKLEITHRQLLVPDHPSAIGSRKPQGGITQPHSFSACTLHRGISRAVFLAVLAAIVCAAGLRAATLEGTVRDPSGAAVPGARVSLLSALKALEIRRTDARGRFRFQSLEPGSYQLVAAAPGFSASPVQVDLREAQTQTVDLPLRVSAVTEHVVVSASLGGALAPQVGASVSVVTGRQMEDRGSGDVLDALRGLPGVEVNQTGRRGGVTGVFVRGGNSDYNLVLVDGMEVNDFGGDFDFSTLPADGVEQLEVTRGPASALYGSNAVSSVINVVTRSGDGPAHFSARAEAGSFNTHRLAAGASGMARGWGWAADLSKLVSQGVVANDRFRDQTAFFSLGTSRGRREFHLHFFGNATSAGAPGPYGSDPDQLFAGLDTVSRDKQNLLGYAASYAEQFSPRFRQVLTASVATNRSYYVSPYGDSFSHNLRAVFNTRSEVAVSNRDFLVAGFEYNREQIRNTYIADAGQQPFELPRTSLAWFVENRWTPTRRLFVIAGARLDDLRTAALPPDAFGTRPYLPAARTRQLNPRLSAAYLLRERAGSALGTTRLHASFGTGIRAPSGFELAFTNNPRLEPERSVSFDAGVEQRMFDDRAVLDATYFYNRFEHQIVVLGGSLAHLSSFVSDNLGNARAQGLELSFRLRPARALSVTGSYTRLATALLALNGADAALAPFHVGQPLVRRPQNSGFLDFTWQRGRWMLNAHGTLRGRELDTEPNYGLGACSYFGMPCLFTNKGYVDAGAGFAYRLPRGLELYGHLNNLLDQKYEESLGYPALPLNFTAGIKFTFPAE
jgi:outer membrane receptor protein involved in Fe transport